MFVIIQSISGPAAGRRVHLRSGQTARFGRTEWADYSFAEDASMSDVHFSIDCDPRTGCRLVAQNGAETLLNGEPAEESFVHHGDKISAGQTVFRIAIEGEPAMAAATSLTGADGEPSGKDSPRAKTLCENLSFSDAANSLLGDETTPEEFFGALQEQHLFRDAKLFLARWLPKRTAVWWACQVVSGQEQPKAIGESALACTVRWVSDPTDENRRAAWATAQAQGMDHADSWAAAGAFWSEGSLGAPEYDTPPAADHLTAVAVSMALTHCAETGTPAEIAKRYEQYLERGMKLQSGELQPPPLEGK